jgi:hypothetical protein
MIIIPATGGLDYLDEAGLIARGALLNLGDMLKSTVPQPAGM